MGGMYGNSFGPGAGAGYGGSAGGPGFGAYGQTPYGGGMASGADRGAAAGLAGGAVRGSKGPVGANLYVNNLDPTINELQFRQMFAEYGSILSIKLFAQNHYGFVSFDNAQSAASAISCLNGMSGMGCDGKPLEVSVKKDGPPSGGARSAGPAGAQGLRYAPY